MMLLQTKCLWTLFLATILQSDLKLICLCATVEDIENAKVSSYNAEETEKLQKRFTESSMDSDDLGNYSEDKRWDKNFAVWGKKRWINFPSWGKRPDDVNELLIAQDTPEKKWSKFVSWGKRDIKDSHEKRKMEMLQEPLVVDDHKLLSESDSASNIKSVVKRSYPQPYDWWINQYDDDSGKRDWRGFNAWGKRVSAYPESENVDKRKWSKFTSWGKREFDDNASDIDKRKWSKFVSWGKRSDGDMFTDNEKRKWSKFTSWGKRGNEFDDDTADNPAEKREWMQIPEFEAGDTSGNVIDDVDKRNWAKFASWGKRPGYQPWLALNAWGKRRWSGLRTWGKRSAENPKAEILAHKLLQLFDSNGDGALDFDELHTYIQILMSLPSRTLKSTDGLTEENQH